MDTYTRALAYLEKLPNAISGAGGHNATMRAACECFRFGLSASEAWDALQWFNANRCSPTWTEKQLRHKLEDAQRIVGSQTTHTARKPARVFVPPVVPTRKQDTRPVSQRSAEDEESWWAQVALERGTTLEVWDR